MTPQSTSKGGHLVLPEAELTVVLDLDDTLYLERDYVRSGFRAAGERVAVDYGVHNFESHCWKSFLSGRRGDLFNAALRALLDCDDPQVVSQLVAVYRSHEPTIELLPDSARFLTWARKHRIPLGLITDGCAVSQRAKIRALGIQDYFDSIVVTAELPGSHSKPDPAAFELTRETLGSRGSFVYIADNPTKDFLAPNTLGWDTVQVRREHGLYLNAKAPDSSYRARSRVSSFDEVYELWGDTNAD